jgi:hypothetical protein
MKHINNLERSDELSRDVVFGSLKRSGVLHRNAVKGGFLALEWTDVQQYKLPKLKRHEDTIVHKAAEMWVKQGKASLHDLVVESAAPTLANFKDLWDQLMRGGA